MLTTALFGGQSGYGTNSGAGGKYKNKLVNIAPAVTVNAKNEMETYLNVHAGECFIFMLYFGDFF